ncbi:MAG: late competence development ComFB family protein [Gracilibacteraceae bacterium]|jgi:competence protein ComFB|nr:late competence development ComFB family protein [Gracilibacteraceae bacterium]
MENEQQKIFNVRNVSEDLVDFYLDECMVRHGACSCSRCIADIRAYALNQLPPRYVVTTAGSAFARARAMSTQAKADIISAISTGINLVKKNPRHDD